MLPSRCENRNKKASYPGSLIRQFYCVSDALETIHRQDAILELYTIDSLVNCKQHKFIVRSVITKTEDNKEINKPLMIAHELWLTRFAII